MEHLRKDWSEFLEYSKNFITEPFTMLDVGCSGGIDGIFKNFGDKIIYYGFDPNINEINRLKSENKNPNIHYVEAFVDCESDKTDQLTSGKDFFEETSATAAGNVINNRIKDSHELMVSNNMWHNMKLTTTIIKIADFVAEKKLPYIDFIKSDIDGLDLSFFKQIAPQTENFKLLAAIAEVSFASSQNDQADLTILLRDHKFSLYSLTTRQYALKYLPDLFSLNIAAQSISGRIAQGDALYVKDGGFEKLSPQQLLKMAIIFDLFDLPDCAASLLNLHQEKFQEAKINVAHALDLLAKQRIFFDEQYSYTDLLQKFQNNPESFYPSSFTQEDLALKLKDKTAKIGDGSLYRIISAYGKMLPPAQQREEMKVKKRPFYKKHKKLTYCLLITFLALYTYLVRIL